MNSSRRPQLTKKIKAALNNCLSGLLLVLLFGAIAATVLSSRHFSAQASNDQSDKAAQSKGSENPHRSKHVDEARRLAASYYSLKNGLSASLMLSNQGPHPMDIRVILFSLNGERLDLPAMTLEPTTVRNYDLGPWAAAGGGSFQEGSLQVLYNGMSMELGGAVKMINAKKSLILDEELSEPGMDFASTRLEGVWWLPSRKAELRLALSNVTNSYLTTTVTVEQNDAKILTLSPHETRVINLSHGEGDFGGVKLRTFGGISITHTGFKGALLARGFVTDANVGYSQVVEFKDPGVAKSSSLNGAGLRLGKLNGKALHPVAVARNTGTAPTIVTGRIRYTTADGTMGVANLPQVSLEAGETKTIDVESAANAIGSLQNLVAGLEFDYTTAPGSVIISAESYSTDDNQVYRVSVIDALAQMSSTGKYPWNLNNGASTVVYLKNVTDQEQQYYLYANYKGGFWIQGIKTIAPHQTVALDMRQVKEQQLKDEKGNTLPTDAVEGQVFWSGRGKQNLVLIGRVEQVEAGGGMSFTTACGTCCFPEYVSAVLTFGSSEGTVGDTTQFYAFEQESDCYHVNYPSLTPASGAVSWTSSDTTIATVSSSGLVMAVGPGTATITATWNGDNWQYNPMGGCDPDTGYCGGFNGGGSGDGSGPYGECQYQPIGVSSDQSYGVRPRIDSVSPAYGAPGNVIQVSINGAGFAAGSTVQVGGSGITVSGTSVVSSTQITANFTIAGNASGGAVSVTVTSGGHTSDSVAFSIRVPHHLLVVSDTGNNNIRSNCQAVYGLESYPRIRQITYQVVDCAGNDVGAVTVQENFTNMTTNTCGNPGPTPASCFYPFSGGSIFTDTLTVNCNNVNGSCGNSFTEEWQWCPSGGTVRTLATLTYSVHYDIITINQNTSGFAAGTPLGPTGCP